MSRLMILGPFTLAATVLPFTPAAAQPDSYYGYDSYDDPSAAITVTAPHARRVGRGTSGAPIMEQSVSQAVSYDDLDLRTADGRDALFDRVDLAARDACATLDEAFPVINSGLVVPSDCRADARRRAASQVRYVIAYANGY